MINSPTTFLRTIAALAFVLGTVPVLGQGPHVENIVSTRHQAVVGGKTIQYTATAGLLPIYVNDTGQQMASVFFIAYTVERPQGQPPRPITFLWNGGPGSNSAQIHVVGFGPKRVKTADTYPAWGPSTETEMVDNQETWLDTSDLVFVESRRHRLQPRHQGGVPRHPLHAARRRRGGGGADSLVSDPFRCVGRAHFSGG